MNDDFLHRKLNERKKENSFRQLRLPDIEMIDFCSNDYLGIVKNKLLEVRNASMQWHAYGSTGSRLLTGNYPLIEETEKFIAEFHNVESALIFNSGYDANVGLLSSVPQRGDTILYDYLSHASIRDGIRLSFAASYSFQHNDLNDLESKLKKASGNIFVATESVFSMDGDLCPFVELMALCERYNAQLIIDEAHATGVIGENGEGLTQMLKLESKVFARVHTFGKAIGVHGAVVLGSDVLRDYLINFARPFIYSTALPWRTISHIRTSYELLPSLKQQRAQLNKLIAFFKNAGSDFNYLANDTPIQVALMPGNEKVKKTAFHCQREKLDVRPILYPTVPKGQERLRIVLHSFNTENEVEKLLYCLKNRT